ncbi:MAG TPA: metallophosphoesterase [Actinomycetota bacterium]|nr:metallophosphoesterase [Actinomycetota bacterium]
MLPEIIVALGVVAMLCVAYGVLVERRAYRLVRRGLAILPTGGPVALTILHLSDLHFVKNDRRKAAFLSSLPPADVTVVTGDLVAEPEAVETVVEALRPLGGRHASWYVLGSNDYYVPRRMNPFRYFVPARRRRRRRAPRGRVAEMRALLADDGWRELTNVREETDLDGLPIELLGLDDSHIARQDLRLAPRVAPERFGIAVMHSPDSAPEAVACGYRLLVAGHTHGGQVRMPFVGALVTNSDLPRRLASGMIRFGGSFLHVSPGLGTSKYAPFRFLCPPEATLLELRRAPDTEPAGDSTARAVQHK